LDDLVLVFRGRNSFCPTRLSACKATWSSSSGVTADYLEKDYLENIWLIGDVCDVSDSWEMTACKNTCKQDAPFHRFPLSGEPCSDCQENLFARIQLGEFDFPEEEWCRVSDDAKDLICRLLVRYNWFSLRDLMHLYL
jgi:hypothetical protein